MELEVKTEVEGSVAIVSVKGEVDVSNAESVRRPVEELLDREDVTHVVVDLGEVPYIDSTGIGVLVGGSSRAKDAGKELTARNATASVARIFGMLGVDGLLEK